MSSQNNDQSYPHNLLVEGLQTAAWHYAVELSVAEHLAGAIPLTAPQKHPVSGSADSLVGRPATRLNSGISLPYCVTHSGRVQSKPESFRRRALELTDTDGKA